MLEISQFSIGLNIITQRGTTSFDSLGENGLNRLHKPCGPLTRHRMGAASRTDPGAPECFAGIDIAYPRDQFLIEQGRLDRGFPAAQRAGQIFRIEVLRQRFRADRAQMRAVRFAPRRDQIHIAEATCIIEDNPSPIGHLDDDMVVLLDQSPAGIVPRLTGAGGGPRRNGEPPRHAQMREPSFPAVEAGENVFRPPNHFGDNEPGQPLGKVLGQGKAKIGAAGLHPCNALAFERGA